MPLSVGEKLGPYEILALIGAGGMGEVYRARDTKLDRDVAIKVLPPAFAGAADRMARFEREAKVLASLNHPNIAHIYGVEERALVMELVEGESPKGPMPFDDAWKIALQIADALEYAHEKGVIHRDLKPANVRVTPEGIVKLLDFGLAKALSAEPGESQGEARATDSPTLTMGATVAGVILGTAAYMAPEQAKGKKVDKRADIWSWGVVLYELLTGERMFKGSDVADTLAHVLTKGPDLERVPVRVRKLLRRCLEKDPKQRLRDIGEARFLLSRDSDGAEAGTARSHSRLGIGVAVLGWAAALALGYVGYRHYTEEVRVMKFSVLTPEKADLSDVSAIPAISPDGRHVAFAARVDGQQGLWIRDLSGLNAHLLPGTSGAANVFWSPDSHWVGFFAEGKVKKIDIAGGPALTLCEVPATGRGGTWNKDDVIVYGTQGNGLFRISAAGGPPVRLSEPEPGYIHRAPWFLPDGRHFLYTVRNNTDFQKSGIYVGSIDSRPGSNTQREVVRADSNAIYAAGHLLFLRDRTLMAQAFDPGRAQITGDAVPLAEQVDFFFSQGQFSASENGVLVYTSGASALGASQLTWFDRVGKTLGTVGPPANIEAASISPDGNTVAVDRRPTGGTDQFDIWLHDLSRGTDSRFTFGPVSNTRPVWSADGSNIAFSTGRDGNGNPYRKATNGLEKEEVIDKDPRNNFITDSSRDGRYLIEQIADAKTLGDIWVIPQSGEKKPYPYINTEFNEFSGKLSPNGQWLAYTSDESKRNEVYVQTFPEHGGKWQVSTGGGDYPVWSRDGRELYFISADRKLMAVEVRGSGAQGGKGRFEAGVPKPLFEVRAAGYYDVSKDGRFLMLVPQEQAATNVPITVVLNWPALLKK